VILAHCPDKYSRIDFEEVESGTRLTAGERSLADVFHSRLTVSPDGRYLVSAGWVWHPVDTVVVFDIARALRDPSHLDGDGVCETIFADECSVAFSATGDLLVGCAGYDVGDGDDPPCIKRFRLPGRDSVETIALDVKPGSLMPVGDDLAFSFFDMPRLLDLRTGVCLKSWPDVPLNVHMGATAHPVTENRITIAPDAAGRRFAVADGKSIRIFQIEND